MSLSMWVTVRCDEANCEQTAEVQVSIYQLSDVKGRPENTYSNYRLRKKTECTVLALGDVIPLPNSEWGRQSKSKPSQSGLYCSKCRRPTPELTTEEGENEP